MTKTEWWNLSSQDRIKIHSDLLVKAGRLGRAANINGFKSVPAQDPELMKIIGECDGRGITISLLDAWSNAWHYENLRREF